MKISKLGMFCSLMLLLNACTPTMHNKQASKQDLQLNTNADIQLVKRPRPKPTPTPKPLKTPEPKPQPKPSLKQV